MRALNRNTCPNIEKIKSDRLPVTCSSRIKSKALHFHFKQRAQ